VGNTEKFLQFIFCGTTKICAMLDRSIYTKEPLIHSILISEVKDMKCDVLQAIMGYFLENNFELCF
jgi:hypothetical protein